MKLFIVLSLLSSMAFANTVESVFRGSSNLPVELRQKVIDAVKKKVPCVNGYSLIEDATGLEVGNGGHIDNGEIALYYTTTLRFGYMHDYHDRYGILTVKSEIVSPNYQGGDTARVTEVINPYHDCQK
jgi:hypothetical protein